MIEARFELLPAEHPVTAWGEALLDEVVTASIDLHDPDDFAYEFRVMHSPVPNAFTTPDGHIYMTSGLLLAAGSCAEIVGVLGHEVGHVIEHHAVDRASDTEAAGCLGELIFGDGGGDAFEVGGMILGGTAFSQRDESEADEIGVKLTAAIGYDPAAIVDFFGRLPGSDQEETSFWSTHPASGARIKAIYTLVGQLPTDEQEGMRDCYVANMNLEKTQTALKALSRRR